MSRIGLAIVGLGKIARDQHVPSLKASPAFELIAVASPHSRLEGVPNYPDLAALLKAVPNLPAVSLCTTPQARFETARVALEHGCHVLLEKPPAMTTSEVHLLEELARTRGVALLASWHSRHANGVEPARTWLQERQVRKVEVVWKEDVRIWHPGQTWIWKAGGLGVFDPGINALSILTRILPGSLVLNNAELYFPKNCETPIAAQLQLTSTEGATVHMALDFLHTGTAHWNIEVDTDAGQLRLVNGGGELQLDGRAVDTPQDTEYARVYAHFARLVRERRGDVDLAPFRLVADAFLCGRRVEVAPFVE
ncbi:MAG TPA: Gfo/Idh/MocA family oxidoreductase [Steroidobacteraceae bacterium]|nr:Gfo/Idh/MocA family oxidoreductase [Steroidobacteraceae bacterium]